MARDVFGIFSGGGVKGAAFLGAIEASQKYVNFVGWGGTSAGAIVAALLACGHSVATLRTRLYSAPYADFFCVQKRRLLFFHYYRGMVDPAPLLNWLRAQIGERFSGRSRVTFSDLTEAQYLKIVAANITTQEIVIYSKRTTPKMEIAQAVLASCSFPLLFPAVRDGTDEVVDGGVLSNFPLWLFHDEEELQRKFTPVLGFTLVSKAKDRSQVSILAHAFSIFDSVLMAQDRVQEKYADAARLSNVICIDVGEIPTFSTTITQDQHNTLLLAGKDAAEKYFASATADYGEKLPAPSDDQSIELARQEAANGNHPSAVSAIARQHIFRGGIARDDGLSADRVFVKYYIDLMEAATDHAKLEVLAKVLVNKIELLESIDRIVGLKKGNIILSYAVARMLGRPLSVFKTDMSYKMGAPFDGLVKPNEQVVVVDDIASDASMLLNAVRYLHFYGARVHCVMTVIERTEGDARERLMTDRGVVLRSICSIDDRAIEKLIYESKSFPGEMRS